MWGWSAWICGGSRPQFLDEQVPALVDVTSIGGDATDTWKGHNSRDVGFVAWIGAVGAISSPTLN
jgi:hypothetical protein